MQIDSDYAQWLNEITSLYRSAQIKAAVKVNAEQLLFNWQLGRDLVTRKAEEQWGAGVVEQLSMDLQAAFPESKGFSTSNLWYMKQWYEFYSSESAQQKLQQLVGEIQTADNQSVTKLHQLGGAITNFADKLPSPQSELAQAITKDTYDFGFISLEDGYKEEALETELEKQLTRFLLELGTGFAYMGRQKQLIIAGKTRKLDMLFFHIPLNCYVVVELKTVPFQPEFAGKLNFYVNAVDGLIKTSSQNPTIGRISPAVFFLSSSSAQFSRISLRFSEEIMNTSLYPVIMPL